MHTPMSETYQQTSIAAEKFLVKFIKTEEFQRPENDENRGIPAAEEPFFPIL